MAEELDWQPVRYVRGEKGHWNGHYGDEHPRPYYRSSSEIVGKIIRVRPTAARMRKGFNCGGLVLEIHPEDAKHLLGFFGDGCPVVCEHQILAD